MSRTAHAARVRRATVIPALLADEKLAWRVHGNDERMSIENVKRGVRTTFETLGKVVYD